MLLGEKGIAKGCATAAQKEGENVCVCVCVCACQCVCVCVCVFMKTAWASDDQDEPAVTLHAGTELLIFHFLGINCSTLMALCRIKRFL